MMDLRASRNQNETNSLGYQLLFCESPASLKEIAAFTIAIEYWFDTICRKTPSEMDGGYEYYEVYDDVDKICGRQKNLEITNLAMKNLSAMIVPDSVKKIIGGAIESVCDCMSRWVNQERQLVFEDAGTYSTFHSYLRCCFWRLNSTSKIDYKKSAENLISKFKSGKHKCKLVVNYCLEDKVRDMSSRLLDGYDSDDDDMEVVTGEIDDEECDPNDLPYVSKLKTYWTCYLKNDFEILSYQNAGSVANYMIMHHDVSTWAAVEYFWDQLDHNDRVAITQNLLHSKSVARFHQKQLLLKMTEFQRCEIITKEPITIILNFWLHSGELDLAFEVWTRVNNKLSGNQFASLIDAVLSCRDINAIQEGHNVHLLSEIWRTAPINLKNFILSSNMDMIVKAYNSIESDYPRNLEFLSLVLSCLDVNRRVGLIFDHGFNFIQYNTPSSVYEVIKVCFDFPNGYNELQRFKKSVMESPTTKAYCSKLLNTGDFKNLNALFKLYPHDEINIALEHRKNLVETYNNFDSHCNFIFEVGRWNELCDFIDETYEASDLVTNVKKRFISGYSANCDNFFSSKSTTYSNLWRDNRYLDDMLNVAENFLCTEEMNTFKQNLLDGFSRNITAIEFWFNFKEEIFHKFELWCLGSEQNILEFKLSLLVDDIFDAMFVVERRDYYGYLECPSRNIVAVETFLRWYFVTPKEVRDYKLRRIFQWDVSTILKDYLLKMRRHGSEPFRKIILWFFDSDVDQIKRFKSIKSMTNLFEFNISYPVKVYNYRLEDLISRITYWIECNDID